MRQIEALFLRKVTKTKSCWLWIGTFEPNGYGVIRFGADTMKAHRFAYELFVGEIADGLVIHHECNTRNCVNPAHLRAVTHRENVLAGGGPTAQNARKTHCRNGHEYPANAKTVGKRKCYACKRASARAFAARARANHPPP